MAEKSVELKRIVGLVEEVTLKGEKGSKKVMGRVDTGAERSSIDSRLAEELGATIRLKTITIRSAHGRTDRPVVKCSIEFAGKKIKAFFTLADRAHMRYKVLVGQNILKRGFLIDPSK